MYLLVKQCDRSAGSQKERGDSAGQSSSSAAACLVSGTPACDIRMAGAHCSGGELGEQVSLQVRTKYSVQCVPQTPSTLELLVALVEQIHQHNHDTRRCLHALRCRARESETFH